MRGLLYLYIPTLAASDTRASSTWRDRTGRRVAGSRSGWRANNCSGGNKYSLAITVPVGGGGEGELLIAGEMGCSNPEDSGGVGSLCVIAITL